jgi:glycosyltransferase involved in cell wall biosynthesis
MGDYAEYAPHMDRIVVISPFHRDYFINRYNIRNVIVTDLPVRTWDYDNQDFPKITNRMIFTSVPERGLGIVAKMWGAIKRDIPDASLVITSDYRLWGVDDPMNADYRRAFIGYPGAQFLGAVRRDRLIKEQLQAELHIYPCVYDELFCIAVAESLVAGAFPITSVTGALKTTNSGGLMIDGNPKSTEWQEKFIQMVVSTSKNPSNMEVIKANARKRFGVETIVKYWEDNIFK